MQDIHVGFRDSDRTTDTDALIRFLEEADRLPSIRACRQRMLDVCPVEAGQRILDVGCGIGSVALGLASFVGPRGLVVGIDKNAELIAEAGRRAAGLRAVTYEVGDAERLDVAPRSFDTCRAERVLMYLSRPGRVVDAMLGATRSGGTLAFFELDYDGIVVDAADRDLTREIVRLVADSVPSPWIARQLPGLLRHRGLRQIVVTPHTVLTPHAVFHRVAGPVVANAVRAGRLSPDATAAWWDALARAQTDGAFFAGFHGFIVSGRVE